jgi:1,4-alpha-glucan branching enzyme
LLVWSGKHGYPGDSNYLDFHKKRHPGGHRYWAVTSVDADLADKEPYYVDKATERVPENADHFTGKVTEILKAHAEDGGEDGILVAPYDAELFGHWWFEGPQFLKRVLRNIAESTEVESTFLHEHLARRKPTSVISIPEGSWGQGNNHYIWLNKHTDWTWKHIYEAEDTMCDLARRWASGAGKGDQELEDILKQTARELMLLSSSDWQFLISTWSARDYGELRISEHYGDFVRLAAMAEKKLSGSSLETGDIEFFTECCARDCLFSDIDLEWFATVEYPAEPVMQT